MAIKGKDNKMIQSGNYLGNISRTKVKNFFDFRTTFKAGKLFPIYAREIYPAMNTKIDCAELVRSITPLGPTMDNAFLDIFFFFVPNRLLWDHWEEFIAGYNKEAWAQDTVYTVPQIKFKVTKRGADESQPEYNSDGINLYVHSFLDYLPGACDVLALRHLDNLPSTSSASQVTKAQDDINAVFSISALYPRAYVKIWNDWFRDENLQDELELYTGDNDEYARDFAFDLLSESGLPNACKLHDRNTSALPAPVKGPDVLIPMDNLPVVTTSEITSQGDGINTPAGFHSSDLPVTAGTKVNIYSTVTGDTLSNLVANNVSNTIRMLRLATQTELLLARDARGGTRYTESILSHFHVHNGDARLQRSEYLGSRSIPLNVQQITNTAQAGDNALGNVGGQSVTKDNSFYFSKGFSEYGIILGVACVRTAISYSSGVHKQYQRKGRFDFIWPEFKHIGDVPLLTREITQADEQLFGIGAKPDKVFGYTPYGSELRTGMNFNNGLFRGRANGSLAYLTYQYDYDDGSGSHEIFLDEGFIQQDDASVANTLITQTGPQYYALFHIEEELVIPLDPTSDPGLMDHF